MNKIELRSAVLSANETDELFVSGIVNKTGTWSNVLGKRKKFREKVNKGVFSKALKDAGRIDFLAEHDKNQLLSSTENDSLKLWEDEDGLKMEATIAPTSYGKDTYALIKSNLKNYMSFGFKVLKDSWDIGSDGIYERTIEEIALREVSTVRNPAYSASLIEARGIEVAEDVDIPLEEEKMKEEFEKFKEQLISEMKEQLSLELKNIVSQEIKSEFEKYKQEEFQNQANIDLGNNLEPAPVEETQEEDNQPTGDEQGEQPQEQPQEQSQEVKEPEKYDVSEYLAAIKDNQKNRYQEED